MKAPPESLSPQPAFHRREAVLLFCLLLYAAVLWIWGVGLLDFHDTMETNRALVIRGMLRSGDYVIPRLGTHVYLAKPPLLYWAGSIISYLMGGVSALSVRMVSGLGAMLILLVVYCAVRPVAGRTTAFLASLAAATMPITFEGATCGLVNMTLSVGVAIAILGGFYMLESERYSRLAAVLCGVGLAAGFLAKGPIVFMFFVPAMLAYLGFRHDGPLTGRPLWCAVYIAAAVAVVWLAEVLGPAVGGISALLYLLPAGMMLYFAFGARQARTRGWEWLIAGGVCIALVAPWPILAAHRLGFHTLMATLSEEAYASRIERIGASNYAPPWLYFVDYPLAALPFSLLAPLPFLPRYSSAGQTPRSRLMLLAKCWLLGALLIFTFSTSARRIRYMIPAFPPVAILAADVMERAARGDLRDRMQRYVRALAGWITYALCAVPFVLLAIWLRRVPDMHGWAVASAAVAAVGAAAGVYLRRVRKLPWAPLLALAIVLIGMKTYVLIGSPAVENPKDPTRAMARSLRESVPAGQPIYLYALTSRSIMFYLDPQIWRDGQTAAAVRGQDHVYVCMEQDVIPSFPVPEGYSTTELMRVESGRWHLVLLRLDRTGAG
jgi:4-amino-4-deoxy-L-arabinose transferase-like glycosyltransferase